MGRKSWIAGVLAGGAAFALATGCRSMPKDRLEERLRSLGKNAPLAKLGLERTTFEHLGETFELLHVRIPARSDAAGRPVVLVHGTPSTLYTWTEIALGGEGFAGLAEGREVVLIEVPGHGIARGDLAPYTFQRCADFVVAAVRALGLEDVHLVGQSYGGEFAWRAAASAPDLFRSLVVMDSSGYPRREGDWLPEEVEMRENRLAKIGWIINAEDRIEKALAPHFTTIPPDRTEEFFLCCENAQNWKAMVDLVRDENGEGAPRIAGIELPTLVMWGADDIAYEPAYYAQRFVDDLPNGRLLLVEGAGHYPHEERPAEVVSALASFFEETER